MEAQANLTHVFRSPNLLYRAVESEDESFIYTLHSEPGDWLNQNPSLARPYSRADAKRFTKMVQNRLLSVVICLPPAANGEPTPIGRISLNQGDSGDHHRHAMLGIMILKQYQGQGYGSEAIGWCLDWAFEMAGLHHLELYAFSWNPRAIALYERLGFQIEGRHREHLWFNGGWHDEICMGILESEWRQRSVEGKVLGSHD